MRPNIINNLIIYTSPFSLKKDPNVLENYLTQLTNPVDIDYCQYAIQLQDKNKDKLELLEQTKDTNKKILIVAKIIDDYSSDSTNSTKIKDVLKINKELVEELSIIVRGSISKN